MRERALIAGGGALFLILFTYPLGHAAALGTEAKQPKLQLPTQSKECVAPLPYMRAAHMQLLIEWRENVVRQGVRQIHATNGKSYEASLTKTCLGECHTNKAEFCDRCHTYTGVSTPYCWDCHNKPQLVAARRTP